jgi:MmyB-like transcription regulator ligand binding domain
MPSQTGLYSLTSRYFRIQRLSCWRIASALGVREAKVASVVDRLVAIMRERRVLLILDNFEHVLPAGAAIAELLGACPLLRVVATSREALHVAADYRVTVALLRVSPVPSAERNLVRRHFLPPRAPAPALRHERSRRYSRYAVGQLRSASARYPTDGALALLVAGPRADSQEFAALWESGDVPIGQHRAKSVDHPSPGTSTSVVTCSPSLTATSSWCC